MSIEANDLSRLSVQLRLAGEPMHLHKNHGPMVNSTARLLIHGMKLFLMTWSTLYSQMMSKGFTTLQCLNTYFKEWMHYLDAALLDDVFWTDMDHSMIIFQANFIATTLGIKAIDVASFTVVLLAASATLN